MADSSTPGARTRPAASGSPTGLTDDEKAAIKDRARETRRRGKADPAQDERDALDKIAAMPEEDRVIAQLVHDVIRRTAPQLAARTWYGMPAYALDGTVLCFVKPASKFRTRYATLGFSDAARLDDGDLWPTEFAVTTASGTVQARIEQLVRAAVG